MDFQVVVFFKPESKGKTTCNLVMYKDNYTKMHKTQDDVLGILVLSGVSMFVTEKYECVRVCVCVLKHQSSL